MRLAFGRRGYCGRRLESLEVGTRSRRDDPPLSCTQLAYNQVEAENGTNILGSRIVHLVADQEESQSKATKDLSDHKRNHEDDHKAGLSPQLSSRSHEIEQEETHLEHVGQSNNPMEHRRRISLVDHQ